MRAIELEAGGSGRDDSSNLKSAADPADNQPGTHLHIQITTAHAALDHNEKKPTMATTGRLRSYRNRQTGPGLDGRAAEAARHTQAQAGCCSLRYVRPNRRSGPRLTLPRPTGTDDIAHAGSSRSHPCGCRQHCITYTYAVRACRPRLASGPADVPYVLCLPTWTGKRAFFFIYLSFTVGHGRNDG